MEKSTFSTHAIRLLRIFAAETKPPNFFTFMKQNVFSPTLLTTAGTAPRAFLFDFDLTLADGSAWIVACYHEVLARHGFAAVDDETIRGTIGLTVEDSFALMTGIDDAARLHDLRVEYKALCRPGMAAHTRLFPDAGRFLHAAAEAGVALGVISTKETPTLRESLERCGVLSLFALVVGLDEVSAPKPSPEGILYALDRLGLAPADAIYFGDNPVDAQAAHAAGTAYVGVAKGVHDAAVLAAYPHRAVIGSYDELIVQR